MNTLRKGDSGDEVVIIQKILSLTPDGGFGPKTEKAIIDLQKAVGLEADGIVGLKTWAVLLGENEIKWSRDEIQKTIEELGYEYNTEGLSLNIVGIRNNKGLTVTDHYDDFITLSYKVKDEWRFHAWSATTDPGLHWLGHPLNKDGCAILAAGQYKDVYKIDKHQGKYKALCQRNGKVKVYRDGNQDDIYDYDDATITEGWFGINIHRSSAYKPTNYVNKYSAGCQVFQDPDDFDEFMDIVTKSKYTTFTYTLIEAKDIT